MTYAREPKLGFEEWAAFNGPIATLLFNRLLTQPHLFEPRTVYQLET